MMQNFVKIKDHPDLRRGETGAVLNVDNQKLVAYRKQRDQKVQFSQALDDINTLKEDMKSIKFTLDQILGALKTNG
jgi:hypothetical protein